MARIVRDLLILVAFCSAFYMLTLFVGTEDQFSSKQSNFSRDRLLADESLADGDWESALEHYDALLVDDPYNELAIVRKALADFKLTEERFKEYAAQKVRVGKNEAAIKRIDSEVAEMVSRSLVVQEPLLDLYRFRVRGLRNLVILNCLGGNKTQAIEALVKYSEEAAGNMRSPLSTDQRLEILWKEPEFFRLYMKERNEAAYYGR